jgi:hypothetical protein
VSLSYSSFRVRAAGITVAAASLSAVSHAQTEIKFGHVGEPGSLYQIVGDEFARRANALLAGKAKVVVYGSSQLGGDKEMLQKLRLGTLDLSLPSTIMSSEVDLLGMFLHSAAAIILVVPIVMPLVRSVGIDPVHFGLIVTINLGIGQQTPPVAGVLMVASSIAKASVWEVTRVNVWFIGILLAQG